MTLKNQKLLQASDFDALFSVLSSRGYSTVGPVQRDGAIVYEPVTEVGDLAVGWRDNQGPGSYQLEAGDQRQWFGFNNGPHSWKKFLFPAKVKLWEADRQTDAGVEIRQPAAPQKPFAFIGVRACDLKAMEIQDRVFLNDAHPDPIYAERRSQALIVAVNCGQAANTCFCTSMNAGPRVTAGFDLALTEILSPAAHYFVVEARSDRGLDLMQQLPLTEAKPEHIQAAEDCSEQAVQQMGRTVDSSDLQALLYRNYNNERWQDLAQRCLDCGNCTMACPTCFCSKVEDITDLTGDHAERWREWDSCFTMDFSYLHGGSLRTSTGARYRQWLTHKLATWIDQFGSSGCVGCGRCISWCPVGIDLTEEVRLIRENDNNNIEVKA